MFIYWIHLPEHIDISTDGYIGVSKNFNQRMFAHKSCAKTGKEQSLYRAIRKYGWDNLIKEIILISDNDYCLAVEKKLRPADRIGWNIALGGGEITGVHLKGIKQSSEHLANRKKSLIGRISGFKGKKHTQSAIEKTMKFVRGIAKSNDSKMKISILNSKPLMINEIIYPSWKEASQSTGIPTGSISYLIKNKPLKGKWSAYDVRVVM